MGTPRTPRSIPCWTRRNAIYIYHKKLLVAHSARVSGFQMFADGMPRLRSAGFVADK